MARPSSVASASGGRGPPTAESTGAAICRLLLSAGASLDVIDSLGRSACWLAAALREEAQLALLLQANADPSCKAFDGAGALRVASETTECARCVEMLLGYGAAVDETDSEGTRALTVVCERGEDEAAGVLLRHGADVTLCDGRDGATPLFAAAAFGHLRCVNVLLQHGANPDEPDRDGRLPMQAAFDEGHSTVVDLLRSAGGDAGALSQPKTKPPPPRPHSLPPRALSPPRSGSVPRFTPPDDSAVEALAAGAALELRKKAARLLSRRR